MVGARRIAAHAQPAEYLAVFVVQGQTAAKHVDAADLLTYHRVVGLTVLSGIAAIGHCQINRIALLQTEQAASWLNSRVQVGRREGEFRKAERIGRIRLLRRDDAAARPLIAA